MRPLYKVACLNLSTSQSLKPSMYSPEQCLRDPEQPSPHPAEEDSSDEPLTLSPAKRYFAIH
jgi:hypothetical protein